MIESLENFLFQEEMPYSFDSNTVRKLDRIHPYPAKFTVDLALQHIARYSNNTDCVLDPFCGSGTTLLACRILGRQGFGFDINFIAHLITQAKILDLDSKDLEYLKGFIDFLETKQTHKLHSYENIHHWFKQEAIVALSHIKECIKIYTKNNPKYTIFLSLIFSSIINIASNQDSDTRYASVEKPYINQKYIIEKYKEKYKNALSIYENLYIYTRVNSQVFLHNAKKLTQKIPSNTISLIFTSPPYPNTYDYYLYHKHRMLWLDFDVKFCMQNEIGSRREYSSLKLPKEKFNTDLLEIFMQCNEVLQKNGIIVLVMGDGRIAGWLYNAKEELLQISKILQWHLIDYSYNELDSTSKSFKKTYRTKNKKEHIMVFQKS